VITSKQYTHIVRERKCSHHPAFVQSGKNRLAPLEVAHINPETLVAEMVGRKVENLYAKQTVTIGQPLLRVSSLSGNGFEAISFEVLAGEVLGVFGLVGSGHTEVARALFGAERAKSGRITLGDTPLALHSPGCHQSRAGTCP
jgi:ABC-type sugar transport system ATPase subunit